MTLKKKKSSCKIKCISRNSGRKNFEKVGERAASKKRLTKQKQDSATVGKKIRPKKGVT